MFSEVLELEPKFVGMTKRLKRHVVFVGAYGIESAGDDAPLVVLIEGLRRRHPDVDLSFTVIARHPDPLLERLDSLAGVRFIPNLEYDNREAARGRWFKGLNPGDDRTHLGGVEAAIKDADLVVAGAGNFFLDLTIDLLRGPVPLFATYAFLADLHQTPFFLYGISAGPLTTDYGRDLAAWMVRRSAAVTCRDEESRRVLESLVPDADIELLPDPVLGLRRGADDELAQLLEREGIPARGERPRLALALRDLSFLDFDRAALVGAVRRLSSEYELLFVPQCTYHEGDDRVVARAIADELRASDGGVEPVMHHIEARYVPSTLMRAYESADATLAIRLHGAVFSAMAGVAPASIAYLPKVSSFLGAAGMREFTIDVHQASSEQLVDAIVTGVARSRASTASDRSAVRARCTQLGADVERYVDRVGGLLALDVTEPHSDAA